MAINKNVDISKLGTRAAIEFDTVLGTPSASTLSSANTELLKNLPINTAVLQTIQPAVQAVMQPVEAIQAVMQPAINPNLILNPNIISALFPVRKTTTQLAKSAINQLKATSSAILTEAINTIRNTNLLTGGLMGFLERKVRVGEVLNELAKDWSEDTKSDFAEAFKMSRDKLDTMDSIVSIAILNDSELEEELRVENTSQATSEDLYNRKIVWQSVPAGTELTPPYMMLVAVDYRDIAKAEDVVKSIMGELTDYLGFKIPTVAAQKLK